MKRMLCLSPVYGPSLASATNKIICLAISILVDIIHTFRQYQIACCCCRRSPIEHGFTPVTPTTVTILEGLAMVNIDGKSGMKPPLCKAAGHPSLPVQRWRGKRLSKSNQPWILRCTIRPSTIMTGVPGELYSGSSLFATSRVYGRFDERLGITCKLSPDSNLQTGLQETAHNSIMNTSFARALTSLVWATEQPTTCLNFTLMPKRQQ